MLAKALCWLLGHKHALHGRVMIVNGWWVYSKKCERCRRFVGVFRRRAHPEF